MSDYDDLIKKGFVKDLETVSKSNPHVYWLTNTSNTSQGTPDLTGWVTTHKSLGGIHQNGLPKVKETLLALFKGGKGDQTAAAMTLIIVKYNVVEKGKDVVKEVRTALLGTSSLNQKSPGQVHAEHITTDTLVSLILDKKKPLQTLLEKDTKSKVTGDLVLHSADVFIYPAAPGIVKDVIKNVSDFQPCESCVKTVSASLKRLTTAGADVDLFGVVGKIKV